MENKVSKKEKIKSIEKALDLLELLLNKEKEMSITEISKELHIGVSTVYRILTTLKCRNYIVQNRQTSKYMLGAKLFTLDYKVQNKPNLIKIVMPFLHKLSQSTKETINFGILEGRNVICLSKIESSEALKADIEIGEKLPTHCSAIGKSILAYLPEWEFQMLYDNDTEKLPVFTSNSIPSVEKLKKCLVKVRKRGYSIDREEFKIGINCLGVAIMNNEGKAIAGISVTGPSSRFNLTAMKQIKSSLINISNDISNQFNEINNL